MLCFVKIRVQQLELQEVARVLVFKTISEIIVKIRDHVLLRVSLVIIMDKSLEQLVHALVNAQLDGLVHLVTPQLNVT